ncbi:trans-sulfuration enzyme family protein [Leptospira sp. GIMC2001]|uniref:trans-sulfuration enzyme family protein n=1 Tax=Leptospira sp. GIMC2001 TaxID=1513297 RepID=UPI00234B62E8|nr:aminotransferase class I/II-fold pyridoxal phosphate-dependent enzyme [Leptospira sp. GIMC2001]WCL47702.1 aminotransferase class I/II-fold pyridoxal phosphate-dependent enzyme [Leptospira sp. GIMC2001]
MNSETPPDPKFETLAVRTQMSRSHHREHSTPLFMTSSFVFDDAEQARALFADEVPGNIYTRFSNPNTNELVDKICQMEKAEDGIATASGMSAIFTSFMALLRQGDHVIASRSVFGSTHQILTQILPRYGISFDYADIANPDSWEKLFKPNTRMVFIETPSNPALDLIDLEWLGKLCKSKNVILNVDNCFCTPYLQTPLEYGADLSIHSATKFLDGQGRTIGGLIAGRRDLLKEIRFYARHSGPSLSPFNAWILSKSLETLAVRMERHCQNALELAKYLETLDDIEVVKYPFLPSHPQYKLAKKQMRLGGGVVSFQVKGGISRGRKFLNSLEMFSHSANLGDSRTIATHPASTTHSKLSEAERLAVGIEPGLIRVSVGLEHIDDIKNEIDMAIVKSRS